jgi:hypothetical protein
VLSRLRRSFTCGQLTRPCTQPLVQTGFSGSLPISRQIPNIAAKHTGSLDIVASVRHQALCQQHVNLIYFDLSVTMPDSPLEVLKRRDTRSVCSILTLPATCVDLLWLVSSIGVTLISLLNLKMAVPLMVRHPRPVAHHLKIPLITRHLPPLLVVDVSSNSSGRSD